MSFCGRRQDSRGRRQEQAYGSCCFLVEWLVYVLEQDYLSPGADCFHPNAWHVKTVMSDSSSQIDLVITVSICKALEKKNGELMAGDKKCGLFSLSQRGIHT